MDTKLKSDLLDKIKQLEETKEAYKKASEEVEKLMEQVPLGTMFQDDQTKLVYKIQKAKGRYVSFPEREFVRTKKPTEKTATLSKKEAEENGFKLGE